MKNINFLFLVAFSIVSMDCVSQSYTERYNDLYHRYEYFDNQNKLIGYKYYDQLYNVWKYKDLVRTENTNNYISPINFTLIEKTLAAKQARYDYNVNRIKTAISDITLKTQQMNTRSNIHAAINSRFTESINSINKINRLDYSNNASTNQIIDYLYSQINIIIKEEIERAEPKKSETPNLSKYIGGYQIPLVSEFVLTNEAWTRTKIDNSKSFFYFDSGEISFKRGGSKWLYRDMIFDKYVESERAYAYQSRWGYIFIKEDFTEIILYDHDEKGAATNKYVFTIGNPDKNIIPIN